MSSTVYKKVLFSIDSSFSFFEKRCFDFIKFMNLQLDFHEFHKTIDQFIVTNSETMDLEYNKLNHGINTFGINKMMNIGGIFNSYQEAQIHAKHISKLMFRQLHELKINIYVVNLCRWISFDARDDFSTEYKSKQLSDIQKSPYAHNQQYCVLSFCSLNDVLYEYFTFYLWKYIINHKNPSSTSNPSNTSDPNDSEPFNEFYWKFNQYQSKNRIDLDKDYGNFCDEKLNPSLAQQHIIIYNGYDTLEEQHDYYRYYYGQRLGQHPNDCFMCNYKHQWFSTDEKNYKLPDYDSIMQSINKKTKKRRLLLKNLRQLINQFPIDLLYKIRWYFN